MHRPLPRARQLRDLVALACCGGGQGESVRDRRSIVRDRCIIAGRAEVRKGKEHVLANLICETRSVPVQDDQPVSVRTGRTRHKSGAGRLLGSHVFGRYTARMHLTVMLDDSKGARSHNAPTPGSLTCVIGHKALSCRIHSANMLVSHLVVSELKHPALHEPALHLPR